MKDSVTKSRKRTVNYKSRAVYYFFETSFLCKLIFEKLIFVETCNSARHKPNFRYKSRAVYYFFETSFLCKLIFEKLIFVETCNSARHKPNFR